MHENHVVVHKRESREQKCGVSVNTKNTQCCNKKKSTRYTTNQKTT